MVSTTPNSTSAPQPNVTSGVTAKVSVEAIKPLRSCARWVQTLVPPRTSGVQSTCKAKGSSKQAGSSSSRLSANTDKADWIQPIEALQGWVQSAPNNWHRTTGAEQQSKLNDAGLSWRRTQMSSHDPTISSRDRLD